MIHYKVEGQHWSLGLNFRPTPGGITLAWVWYSIPRHELSVRRLRLRFPRRPWILPSVDRFNVIDNYLRLHDLQIVHRETLQDLRALEQSQKRVLEPWTRIRR